MSESPDRGSWNTGCLTGALLGGVLVAVLLGAAGLGAAWLWKRAAGPGGMALPTPAPTEAAVTLEDDGSAADAGSAEEDAGRAVFALPVLVKLNGVNEKGEVRYLLDGEEEAAGDAALIKALKARREEEKNDPEEDLELIVDLDVATAAGITPAQVDAAVKACWAAGASVLPPPDISKESNK